MEKKNHLLKSHEPIQDFAFRKRVYPASVYSAIAKGKIKPDYVGTTNILMVDLRKYGAYRFRVHNPDKTNLIKWYLSIGYEIKGRKAVRKLKTQLKNQQQQSRNKT